MEREEQKLNELFKTILVYKKGEEEKHIVCDSFETSDNMYDKAALAEKIRRGNPFQLKGSDYCEWEGDDNYEIVDMGAKGEVIQSICVTVEYAIEFKGRLFDLTKSKYSRF